MSDRVGLPIAIPALAAVLIFALALALACGPSGPDTLSTFQPILGDPTAVDSPNQARALFVSKGRDRVDARGAHGRDVARCQRDEGGQKRDGREGDRVEPFDTKQ